MDAENSPASNAEQRCGLVAVLGRPNVGKSTLVNALVGCKVSIVSAKPQTTRHRILGVHSLPGGQIVYVDTPGIHGGAKRALNRQLNRTARHAMEEVDILLQVIEAGSWREEDQRVFTALSAIDRPRILAINKTDEVARKDQLLPFIAEVTATRTFTDVFLISARKRDGLDKLESALLAALPIAPPRYPEDAITDRSERFLAAELVREQLMRLLEQELPYATTVEIEKFSDNDGLSEIHAIIWVERQGQKAIVIGAGGAMLKEIGSVARIGMEKLFDRRVFLKLWVKVREDWSDDEAALQRFGYRD